MTHYEAFLPGRFLEKHLFLFIYLFIDMIPLFLITVLGYVEIHARGATLLLLLGRGGRLFFFSFYLFFFLLIVCVFLWVTIAPVGNHKNEQLYCTA